MLPALVGIAVPVGLVLVRQSQGPARQAFEGSLLYWTMPVVLLLWALVGWWRLRTSGGQLGAFVRMHRLGIAAAVALTGLVVGMVPPTMRVQFDETSLVSVSQSMHQQRVATMATAAVPYHGTVLVLESTVDKRPPLFPFVVSVVHDLTGYRVANAFAVNALLLVVLLAVVHAAVQRRLGAGAALAAQLLLIAVPLLGVTATSAGFELLAAVLFVVVVLAAIDCVHSPDAGRQAWLLVSGLLFAQARYESVVVMAIVLLVVLWRTRGRGWLTTRTRWLAALVPGLLTPLVFLFLNARRPDFYPEAAGQPLVALSHGVDHLGPFLAAFFAPGLGHSMPGLLAILAGLAFLARLLQRRCTIDDLLVVLPVLAASAISLLWFYGDVQEPTALRLFLPVALLGGLGALLWKDLLGARLPTAMLLAGAAVFAGVRLWDLHRGAAFPRLGIATVTEAVDAALQNIPGAAGETLWVTCIAQHLIVKGGAAMTPEAFVRHRRDVGALVQQGEVRQIYVLRTPLDVAFAPQFGSPEQALAGFRTEVVWSSRDEAPISVVRLVF